MAAHGQQHRLDGLAVGQAQPQLAHLPVRELLDDLRQGQAEILRHPAGEGGVGAEAGMGGHVRVPLPVDGLEQGARVPAALAVEQAEPVGEPFAGELQRVQGKDGFGHGRSVRPHSTPAGRGLSNRPAGAVSSVPGGCPARAARGYTCGEGGAMRAVVYARYGGPEALEVREVPRPSAGRGMCLVRVAAASVNPADWKMLAGNWRWVTGRRAPRRPFPPRGPLRIGLDFSGTVAAAGPGVKGFREGDEVMGLVNPLRTGSMAEYVAVPAAALSRRPRSVSLEEAAGLPVAAATAWIGLHHRRRDLAGRRVLVTGAAGGVGHFALQLGALGGARLTAACSAAKAEPCRRLGAAEVLDYTRAALPDLLAGAEPFDLIFDCASRLS